MRRRGIIAAGVLTSALLLSGCTAEAVTPVAWWDEDEVGARFTAGSGGGGLSPETDPAVSLGDSPAGSHRAEAACAGPQEITLIVEGMRTAVRCSPDDWTAVAFEHELSGDLGAEISSDTAVDGSWYVGFVRVED